MEVAERHLETSELEEFVGAAPEPLLNRACDLLVLDRSEIDEVLSALHFGFRLALVGWPVCDGVGDYQGAIDRERLENHNRDIGRERHDHHVREQVINVGKESIRGALGRRQAEQHSILDFVLQDANAVQRKLNGRDRQKLDQYLTSVREIEQRIEKADRMPVTDPGMNPPAGIPPAFDEHIALLCDMMILAFQTDSTRIATMLLAGEGSNRTFSELGFAEGHHNLTHHENREEMIDKVKEIDLWYVKQLARFLEKMEQTKDVDGHSLLHNSMIVYGSGNADGNRHSHNNLPILLAGAGGGLKPGRYVKANAKPLTNLFLTMADRMGAQGIAKHGDSTGRLETIS